MRNIEHSFVVIPIILPNTKFELILRSVFRISINTHCIVCVSLMEIAELW